jgi:hypothetical protein
MPRKVKKPLVAVPRTGPLVVETTGPAAMALEPAVAALELAAIAFELAVAATPGKARIAMAPNIAVAQQLVMHPPRIRAHKARARYTANHCIHAPICATMAAPDARKRLL